MSANAESDLQGSVPAFAWRQIATLAGIVLLIHLICIHRYSYFRDELYYLACAQNLAWGYVDHPPLSIAILKLFTSVFGTELWAVRLPGVLTGVASVFFVRKYRPAPARWSHCSDIGGGVCWVGACVCGCQPSLLDERL